MHLGMNLECLVLLENLGILLQWGIYGCVVYASQDEPWISCTEESWYTEVDRGYGYVVYASRYEPGYLGQRIRLCSVHNH